MSTANFNARKTSVYDCTIIQLPKVHNVAGNITAVNNQQEIPFAVKRVYYLYDVPGGESRGGHAHRNLHQFILAGSGSFDIQVDDGRIKRTFQLNRPDYGLYLPPGLWRELDNFSSGSICLVLASEVYQAADYLRLYEDFLTFKRFDFL
ncbi:MAG: WxcM-like domain-containing protein [Bacteroidetes bacterium]|nr:MAG: WxcM-like domain-containing protein [Bacteroidota bacterium]